MTAKCSPFTDPVSSRGRSPCSPTRTAAGEVGRDLQNRRQEIRCAGRKDREDSTHADHGVDAALDRPVASPDEYHLSASASARRAHSGALRLFVTSYQGGSANPSRASSSRSSSIPPPKLLPACVTTATVGVPWPPCSRRYQPEPRVKQIACRHGGRDPSPHQTRAVRRASRRSLPHDYPTDRRHHRALRSQCSSGEDRAIHRSGTIQFRSSRRLARSSHTHVSVGSAFTPLATGAAGRGQPAGRRPVHEPVRPAVDAQHAAVGIGWLPALCAALIAAAPEVWRIEGSVIGLTAFNAGLQAAREHMVRTDPGSLSAAKVAQTSGEGNPPP
jgi:hypothetical protein